MKPTRFTVTSLFAPFLAVAGLLILTTTTAAAAAAAAAEATIPSAQNLTKRFDLPGQVAIDIAQFNIMKERGLLLYTWMMCHDWLMMDPPVGTVTVDSLRGLGWEVDRSHVDADDAEDEITFLRHEGVYVGNDMSEVLASSPLVPGPGRDNPMSFSSTRLRGYVLPHAGVFVASNIVHNLMPGTDDPHISDVAMAVWRDSCAAGGAPVGGITRYYALEIVNQNTRLAWHQGRGALPDVGVTETFTPEGPNTDTFFALLGSPVALSIPFVLLDYVHELGQRIVTRITMTNTEENHYVMRIDVGDWSPADP